MTSNHSHRDGPWFVWMAGTSLGAGALLAAIPLGAVSVGIGIFVAAGVMFALAALRAH